MDQADFFEGVAFTAGPRSFNPKPTPAGKRRVLFRCTRKGCKFCKAADITERLIPGYAPSSPPIVTLDAGELSRVRVDIKCATHPTAYIESAMIEGTRSEAHQCDPRCTSARGPICICSCGGKNHGCGWL